MADQSIRINIGTSYDGTGLGKAMGAVDKLSKAAGKGAHAIGQIGGAFDSLGGQASKAIGSVTSALGAIASGGLVGGAVAAVGSLVQMFMDMSKEAENAKKAQEKAFADNLNRQIEKYGKNLDTIISKLEKLQAQQQKVAQSTNALNAALADKDIAQRELQEAKDVAEAKPEERGVVQAQANVDITRMKGERSVAAADEAVSLQQGKLNTTNKILDDVGKEIQGLSAKVKNLDWFNRAYHNSAAESGYQDQGKIAKAHQTQLAYDKATKKLAELQERQAALMKQREAQEKDLQTAKENAETARINADAEDVKAKQSLKDAEDKQWEEEEKARQEGVKATLEQVTREKERNDKLRDEKKAEEKLKNAIEKEPQLREELDRATRELRDAQIDLANKMRNAQIVNMGWQGGAGWGGGGGELGGANGANAPIGAGQIINNGINGKNRYDPRNNQSIHDAGYNERKQAGYDRNAQSQGYGLSARDKHDLDEAQGKLDRAAARGENVISKEGREKILGKKGAERYDDLFEKDPANMKEIAKIAGEKAAAKLKQAQQQKEQAEQTMRTNIQEIHDMMKNLGLE